MTNQTASTENDKTQQTITKSVIYWKEPDGESKSPKYSSEPCCQLALWLQISHFTSLELSFLMYKTRSFHLRISKCFPHVKFYIHKGLPNEKYCLCFINSLPIFHPKHLWWKVVDFWLKATFIQSSPFWLDGKSESNPHSSTCHTLSMFDGSWFW